MSPEQTVTYVSEHSLEKIKILQTDPRRWSRLEGVSAPHFQAGSERPAAGCWSENRIRGWIQAEVEVHQDPGRVRLTSLAAGRSTIWWAALNLRPDGQEAAWGVEAPIPTWPSQRQKRHDSSPR